MFFEKVSLVTGGFDPIHSGHISYFKRAKDLSNYLIVGLNTEEWLTRKKGQYLRGCAHNQGCYEQLMEIRDHVIEYLKTLKEVTHHTNADESDELETAKLLAAKDKTDVESLPYTKWR